MIEATVCEYLIHQNLPLIGGHVYLEVPVHPESEYIVIEKTASGEQNKIRSAMIAVQSISETGLYTAAQMNESVIEVMSNFADNSAEIYSCKLNSDYNFTDPETKEYRYQAVFNIYY